MKKISSVFATLLLFICLQSQGQPDHAWLAGTWVGAGFGGTIEETWSVPDEHGVMIGMFRHLDENGVATFFEFWSLDAGGMNLKHFNPDMSGWEEKDGFVKFEMIETSKNKLVLKGLIYEKVDDRRLKISLDLEQDGTITTEFFELLRQQ